MPLETSIEKNHKPLYLNIFPVFSLHHCLSKLPLYPTISPYLPSTFASIPGKPNCNRPKEIIPYRLNALNN